MFINSDFDKDFVREVIKLKEYHKAGLAEKIITSDLLSIISGSFDNSYIESKKVHLAENEFYLAELIILRKTDIEADVYFHSTPFDLCLLPVAGEFNLTEYSVDDSLEIREHKKLELKEDIYLIGKTSKTNKFYVAEPKGESCLIITASSKINCDDYYSLYEKSSLEKTLVSYNLQESRAQMWLEHYPNFSQSVSKELIETIAEECETKKFKEFLKGMVDQWH